MLALDFRMILYLSKNIYGKRQPSWPNHIYYVYPLDFTNYPGLNWIDVVLPWLLIIGMVVSAFKIISNIWKLIFWR